MMKTSDSAFLLLFGAVCIAWTGGVGWPWFLGLGFILAIGAVGENANNKGKK